MYASLSVPSEPRKTNIREAFIYIYFFLLTRLLFYLTIDVTNPVCFKGHVWNIFHDIERALPPFPVKDYVQLV